MLLSSITAWATHAISSLLRDDDDGYMQLPTESEYFTLERTWQVRPLAAEGNRLVLVHVLEGKPPVFRIKDGVLELVNNPDSPCLTFAVDAAPELREKGKEQLYKHGVRRLHYNSENSANTQYNKWHFGIVGEYQGVLKYDDNILIACLNPGAYEISVAKSVPSHCTRFLAVPKYQE